MNYEFIPSVTVEEGISLIATQLVEYINSELEKNKTVNILMSGGNTPKLLYSEILNNHLGSVDWSNCRLIILDERFVSFDSERSNAGECFRYFASIVSLKEFIYPDTTKSIDKCVESYSDILNLLGTEGIKLSILGTADDGHLASIFPEMKIITEAKNCFACEIEGTNEKRVSLTLEFINRSENIWMMALGRHKGKIINMAKSMEYSELPALSLNSENTPKWFISE